MPGLSLLLSTTLSLAPAQVDPAAAKGYAEILAKHVKGGRVDYKAIADKDLAKLDAYVSALASLKPPADRLQAVASYVDAYNALVLRAVIAEKMPRSVLDVKGFFDRAIHKVAGKTLSLNQLEKEVLNPFAKDPRTHMVLVCAAVGCPILEGRPYAGGDVEARLDEATRRYLAAPTGAVAEDGALKLSKIFDWYKGDFGGEAGVLAFAKKHLPAAAAAKAGAAPKISFLEYNWTLNQQ